MSGRQPLLLLRHLAFVDSGEQPEKVTKRVCAPGSLLSSTTHQELDPFSQLPRVHILLSRRRLPLSRLLREVSFIPVLPTAIALQNQTLITGAPYHERIAVVASPGLGTVLKGLAGWEQTGWGRKQRRGEERGRRMEDGGQRGGVTP